jgi:hypothetical protein
VTLALRRQRSHVRIVSGEPVFLYFTARYGARGLELRHYLIPASKQSGEKSSPSVKSLATNDVGRKLAGPRPTIDSMISWIGALGQQNPLYPSNLSRDAFREPLSELSSKVHEP